MKYQTILTVDVEPDTDGRDFLMKEGLKNLEKLSKKYDLKIILYVVGKTLEKNPKLFKRLKSKSMEIASHGFSHKRFDEMSFSEKEKEIRRCLKISDKINLTRPRGFRAPQFSIDFETIKLLEKYKFSYDSSVIQFPISQTIFFPTKFFTYLKKMGLSKKVRSSNLKIREIPVSSFGLPISLFTLRRFPVILTVILAKLSLFFRKDRKIIFLSHSYELASEEIIKKMEKFFEKLKVERKDEK